MQCNNGGLSAIALTMATEARKSKFPLASTPRSATNTPRSLELDNEDTTKASTEATTDPSTPTTTPALPQRTFPHALSPRTTIYRSFPSNHISPSHVPFALPCAVSTTAMVNAIGTQTMRGETTSETPAQLGRRLAQAALPKTYSLTANKVRKTVAKRLAAHVVLPRAQGSMRFKFKLDLMPMLGLKELAEKAGLDVQPVKRIGGMKKIVRTWKTQGASATAKFCSLQDAHPLAWGGAKLKAPAKAATRPVARVMTLVAPPLTVTSTVTNDEESATFEGHLVTFNEKGEMTFPLKHEELWGEATEATERVLKKYAKRSLGDMFVEGLPVSQTFTKNLGKQYASSESEYDSEAE